MDFNAPPTGKGPEPEDHPPTRGTHASFLLGLTALLLFLTAAAFLAHGFTMLFE
ncbi:MULTISPECIES: hypothetical protein [unclassified Streptomyces]|uniref:hypothetical protein n=1 Tax=unclassified Streptomyces TaxID=2593676 RepID=UPI00365F8F4B